MSTTAREVEKRSALVSLTDAIELLTERLGETARDDALLAYSNSRRRSSTIRLSRFSSFESSSSVVVRRRCRRTR
jgi:hypothetical protein